MYCYLYFCFIVYYYFALFIFLLLNICVTMLYIEQDAWVNLFIFFFTDVSVLPDNGHIL